MVYRFRIRLDHEKKQHQRDLGTKILPINWVKKMLEDLRRSKSANGNVFSVYFFSKKETKKRNEGTKFISKMQTSGIRILL